MTIAFLAAAAVAVVATALTVSRPSAVHALLYLIVTLLATALMFLTLGAPFLAALEVIVYAGAVMVLFVFAAMMLDLGPASDDRERSWLTPAVWTGPAVLASVLALELLWIVAGVEPAAKATREVGPAAVGESLLTTYLVGVELASVLLMAAVVGTYHLGRRDRRHAGGDATPDGLAEEAES